MSKNPGTRIGRPPSIPAPSRAKLPNGERQGSSPTDRLDTAIPAAAFPRNRSMPRYHDDPSFLHGGPKRR